MQEGKLASALNQSVVMFWAGLGSFVLYTDHKTFTHFCSNSRNQAFFSKSRRGQYCVSRRGGVLLFFLIMITANGYQLHC